MTDKIVLLSSTELESLVRSAIRQELAAAANQKKEKEFLNAREVCLLLNISVSTLSKWKRENKIPFSKIGKRVFFSRKDVIDSLKDSKYQKLKQLQIR